MLSIGDVRRVEGRGNYTGPVYPHQFLIAPRQGSLGIVLLSPKFEAFEVHWFGRMHRLCTLPSGVCLPCQRGNPTKPLWYGFAQVEGTNRIGVLKLTPTMIDAEPELQRVACARGVQCRLYRWKGCPNGRTCIEVTGTVFDVNQLPKAPDIEQFLLRMFSKVVPQEKGEI